MQNPLTITMMPNKGRKDGLNLDIDPFEPNFGSPLFTTTNSNESLHFDPPSPPVMSSPVRPLQRSLSPNKNPL